VNNNLADNEYNENLMNEGMNRFSTYMTNLKSETNEKVILLTAKLEVEGHILRVNHAMRTVQRNLDLLIDGVIHSQKGVLQPQIASPFTIIEDPIKSVPAFPKDISLPIQLSKDSMHLLVRLYELKVYRYNALHCFVILLPLLNQCNHKTYK